MTDKIFQLSEKDLLDKIAHLTQREQFAHDRIDNPAYDGKPDGEKLSQCEFLEIKLRGMKEFAQELLENLRDKASIGSDTDKIAARL